jgi:hypothetical protein
MAKLELMVKMEKMALMELQANMVGMEVMVVIIIMVMVGMAVTVAMEVMKETAEGVAMEDMDYQRVEMVETVGMVKLKYSTAGL